MPRALTMRRSRTPAIQREAMLERFRRSRDLARSHGVNYWVFTDGAEPSAWVEFLEGANADQLRSAIRQLEPVAPIDPILSEVELD